MSQTPPNQEPIIPRLFATNALRANLSKHMVLNQMADNKASMIMTVASLIITITLTQYDRLNLATTLLLTISSLLALIFSMIAITPPLKAKGKTNLFYFRSFNTLSEEEFLDSFKETIIEKEKLYDAYIREIYYLGKHRLHRKYLFVRNGLWALLFGLCSAALSTLIPHLKLILTG